MQNFIIRNLVRKQVKNIQIGVTFEISVALIFVKNFKKIIDKCKILRYNNIVRKKRLDFYGNKKV